MYNWNRHHQIERDPSTYQELTPSQTYIGPRQTYTGSSRSQLIRDSDHDHQKKETA